jgi:ketosteroid isomerase-like protein
LIRRILLLAACSTLWVAPAVAQHVHGPAPVQAATLTGEAAEAARVVDAFHAALGRGDTAAALALLADDAMIFEAGGVERGKAEYAAHHLGADAAFEQAVASKIARRTGRVEPGVAWILTEGRSQGAFRGRAVDRVTAETMILRREQGRWAIVHIHWSSKAAPGG